MTNGGDIAAVIWSRRPNQRAVKPVSAPHTYAKCSPATVLGVRRPRCASADQVSAGHVDVDCPISHGRDDVLAGTGCAGVCARKRLAGPDRADRAAVKRS